MAVIGENYPTLLEVSRQFDSDGNPLPIADVLTQKNEILDDIPWYEANGTGGHRIGVETSLPESYYRKINQGILPSKGGTADVTESVGMLTALGMVDKTLADLSGNVNAYRVRKNARHFESMGQKFMQTLMYGDSSLNPEQFMGLSPRYSDITGPANAQNIIDAGGTGTDNQSIWLINWGPGMAYGIYPKGSRAGIVHTDYGDDLVTAPDGTGKLPMYQDWFEWHHGIAIEDWRHVVRIANIDDSDLTKDAATGADLIDLMAQALELIEGGGNPVFYTSRRIRSFLRRQISNKSNVWLSMNEVAGRAVTAFDGVPVRRVDRLLNTESRVV